MSRDARHRYGPHVAVITRLSSAAEIVFHEQRGERTRCGRDNRRSVELHIDHAIRIARPCLQCWPIQQLALWKAA